MFIYVHSFFVREGNLLIKKREGNLGGGCLSMRRVLLKSYWTAGQFQNVSNFNSNQNSDVIIIFMHI